MSQRNESSQGGGGESGSLEKKKADRWALVGPSVANFSVQYNFQVIAIALAIAQRDMPQQTWVKTQDKSVIFIGCILGQFLMGYAGDLLGRTRASVGGPAAQSIAHQMSRCESVSDRLNPTV